MTIRNDTESLSRSWLEVVSKVFEDPSPPSHHPTIIIFCGVLDSDVDWGLYGEVSSGQWSCRFAQEEERRPYLPLDCYQEGKTKS